MAESFVINDFHFVVHHVRDRWQYTCWLFRSFFDQFVYVILCNAYSKQQTKTKIRFCFQFKNSFIFFSAFFISSVWLTKLDMKSMFMDRVDEFQLNCSDGFFTLVNFEQFQVECASGAASKPINHIRLCIWVRIYSWGTRRARSIYRIQPAIHKRAIWYRFIRFFLNLIIFFGCALCFYLQHVRSTLQPILKWVCFRFISHFRLWGQTEIKLHSQHPTSAKQSSYSSKETKQQVNDLFSVQNNLKYDLVLSD